MASQLTHHRTTVLPCAPHKNSELNKTPYCSGVLRGLLLFVIQTILLSTSTNSFLSKIIDFISVASTVIKDHMFPPVTYRHISGCYFGPRHNLEDNNTPLQMVPCGIDTHSSRKDTNSHLNREKHFVN